MHSKMPQLLLSEYIYRKVNRVVQSYSLHEFCLKEFYFESSSVELKRSPTLEEFDNTFYTYSFFYTNALIMSDIC